MRTNSRYATVRELAVHMDLEGSMYHFLQLLRDCRGDRDERNRLIFRTRPITAETWLSQREVAYVIDLHNSGTTDEADKLPML